MDRVLSAVAVVCVGIVGIAEAGVRVIHGSPNTPKVDVFAGAEDLPSASVKNRILRDVPYFTASGYLDIPSGTYFVDVVAPEAGYAPAININSLQIDGDRDYTVIAAGSVEDGLDAFLFVDDNTINPSKARVRVIHAYENVTVDVVEKNLGTIADDFAYGTASQYFELPAGGYDFSLRTADGNTTVIEIPTVHVEAGKVYTVYATGFAGIAPQIQLTVDAERDSHTSRGVQIQRASNRRGSYGGCGH